MRGRKRVRRRPSHVGKSQSACARVPDGGVELDCLWVRNGRRMILTHRQMRDDFGHLVLCVRRNGFRDHACSVDPDCEMYP